MTKTAVLICPGRGTYNKTELGYIARHHASRRELIRQFDAMRMENGQESVSSLDGAERFIASKHTSGDAASPLIYASSYLDALSLSQGIDVVAVTGNSMGWYTALAVGGALSAQDGFRVVNTMGTLMHENLVGGQIIYPFVDTDWRPIPGKKGEITDTVARINEREGHFLTVSIDLGGMLVVAGDAPGLAAFEREMPPCQERFPMRLGNHAAFHSSVLAPVAESGRKALLADMFGQPVHPLIDGRGQIWWPGATDTGALWSYTLGHQVTETYDFSKAIACAAHEFAPDYFIVTGPGTTLGSAVAQSLIQIEWHGLRSKSDFQKLQTEGPLLASMGMDDQRPLVAA